MGERGSGCEGFCILKAICYVSITSATMILLIEVEGKIRTSLILALVRHSPLLNFLSLVFGLKQTAQMFNIVPILAKKKEKKRNEEKKGQHQKKSFQKKSSLPTSLLYHKAMLANDREAHKRRRKRKRSS